MKARAIGLMFAITASLLFCHCSSLSASAAITWPGF